MISNLNMLKQTSYFPLKWSGIELGRFRNQLSSRLNVHSQIDWATDRGSSKNLELAFIPPIPYLYHPWALFSLTRFNFIIPAWICNHTPSKVWCEITYLFLNFNGCTVEYQIPKTLGSTSIIYRSDAFASDRYLIDIDPRAFAFRVVTYIFSIMAFIQR